MSTGMKLLWAAQTVSEVRAAERMMDEEDKAKRAEEHAKHEYNRKHIHLLKGER